MTNENVTESIERLRELAPKLNQATDEANRIVGLVERFLNEECSIGVPCEIEARVTDLRKVDRKAEALVETMYLVYARVQGKYHLAVNTVVERALGDSGQPREPVSANTKVWLSCSREEKLATFPKLPALMDRIACEAAEMAERTANAAQSVHEMQTSLDNGNRKQKIPGRTGRRRPALRK